MQVYSKNNEHLISASTSPNLDPNSCSNSYSDFPDPTIAAMGSQFCLDEDISMDVMRTRAYFSNNNNSSHPTQVPTQCEDFNFWYATIKNKGVSDVLSEDYKRWYAMINTEALANVFHDATEQAMSRLSLDENKVILKTTESPSSALGEIVNKTYHNSTIAIDSSYRADKNEGQHSIHCGQNIINHNKGSNVFYEVVEITNNKVEPKNTKLHQSVLGNITNTTQTPLPTKKRAYQVVDRPANTIKQGSSEQACSIHDDATNPLFMTNGNENQNKKKYKQTNGDQEVPLINIRMTDTRHAEIRWIPALRNIFSFNAKPTNL